jgi:hypothetical protein
MPKFELFSNTWLERRATVSAPNLDAAILKAYGVWDRRCYAAGGEPPVGWGIKRAYDVTGRRRRIDLSQGRPADVKKYGRQN